MKTRREIKDGYDKLAAEYAIRFCDELDGKSFDRSLLKRFVEAVPDGPVCDLGCGPGHVAAYLQSLGAKSLGIDLSPEMVAEAGHRFPTVEYRVGDMAELDVPSGSWSGIVALYSIIHLEREELEDVFREMHRVLMPAGQLLVSFHKGEGNLHEDNVLDTDVSFDCTLFEPNEVTGKIEKAGLVVAEATVRRPYDIEYPTQRVYIFADKPSSC